MLNLISFSKPDVEQFLRTFWIGDFAVTPDEKQLVFSTNLSGEYNLWAMNLPITFPTQLTLIAKAAKGLSMTNKEPFIIAGFDRNGDENTQFYGIPLQGGTMKKIIYEEGTRNSVPILSEDGNKLYYTSSKENPTYLNAYVYDLVTGEEKTVLVGKDAPTFLLDFSPNEEVALYYKHFANTNTLLYAKRGEEHILLTPPTDQSNIRSVTQCLYPITSSIY
ncbi:Dipeptidyl aminopeptidase BIII OS=Lysinibacillus sphaericus OX=1421 GN=dapb3_1 PE=4 SV=1 [Lysinibacillus sphaericus]